MPHEMILLKDINGTLSLSFLCFSAYTIDTESIKLSYESDFLRMLFKHGERESIFSFVHWGYTAPWRRLWSSASRPCKLMTWSTPSTLSSTRGQKLGSTLG